MKKVFDFQNESQFDTAYENLIATTDFKRLQEKFTIKPFYFKYKALKTFFSGFTLFIQCVTIAVSFMAIAALLLPMMPMVLALIISCIVLICIEAMKRLTFKPSVKEYLQFKKVSVFNVLIAFSMLGVSLWLTWNGTHETVFKLTEKPTLLNVDSLTGYEKQRIRELTAQLGDIKKTQSWKGVLTPKGQSSYNKVTAQIEKLQSKLDSKETTLSAKNDQTATDHQSKTLERSTHFRFITLALDLLLFVLLGWLEYYDFRSLTEFARLVNSTDNAMRSPLVTNENAMRNDNAMRTPSVDINALRSEIPFSDNNGRVVIQGFRKTEKQGEVLTVKKACQHCGNTFERKTTFQKYCTENCRIRAWENRHGKTFRKQAVK